MEYLENDIEKASKIVRGKCQHIDNIARLYKNTNEDLTRILQDVSFKDKKVLTVLGSSDQLFSSLILGAKEVDTFDVNKLTKYYYYLRKWSIEETKTAILPDENTLLTKIVEKHYDENREVAHFWLKLISNSRINITNSNLFYKPNIKWTSPYIGKEEELIEVLNDTTLNYKEVDILEKTDINKKYDIIILSNIIEYLLDYEDPKHEERFSKDIIKLLEDDGIIVSSNIMNTNDEETILDNYFDKKDGPLGTFNLGRITAPISYQYTKKK